MTRLSKLKIVGDEENNILPPLPKSLIFQIRIISQKLKNIQMNVIIYQTSMCFISMDLSQEAVQSNGKLFFLILNNFSY